MKKVQLESPYRGNNYEQTELNEKYAHLCVADCLLRNEAPFASHILYTKATNDKNPAERAFGIEAGFAFLEIAEMSVVYCNFGISEGMKKGIKRAKELGIHVEYRLLPDEIFKEFMYKEAFGTYIYKYYYPEEKLVSQEIMEFFSRVK